MSNEICMIMKRKLALLTAALIASLSSLHAQQKGDFSVGGSLGIAYRSTRSTLIQQSAETNVGDPKVSDDNGPFQLAVSAEAGYFVTNNIRLTLTAGFSRRVENVLRIEDYVLEQTSKLTAVGPSIAFYLKLADKLYLVPEIGGLYAFGAEGVPVPGIMGYHFIQERHDYVIRGFELTAHLLTLEFKASPRLGIGVDFGSISYANLHGSAARDALEIKSKAWNFDINTTASVGIRYYL